MRTMTQVFRTLRGVFDALVQLGDVTWTVQFTPDGVTCTPSEVPGEAVTFAWGTERPSAKVKLVVRVRNDAAHIQYFSLVDKRGA